MAERTDSGAALSRERHAVQQLQQGAAEATRVRSLQDRHLLFQGLPGAHTTPKRGGLGIKTSASKLNLKLNLAERTDSRAAESF
jgi:hypothetical protein